MNTGVAEPVSAALPSPTRNTANDAELPPPPLELEDEDEDDEEDAEDEDELAPEDDELAPPPAPPPLLDDDELLDDCAPQSPPSPPSPPAPLPMSVRLEPWAQATKTNGVKMNEVKAILIVVLERRSCTVGPF